MNSQSNDASFSLPSSLSTHPSVRSLAFSEDEPDHNPFADAVSPHSQVGTPRTLDDVFSKSNEFAFPTSDDDQPSVSRFSDVSLTGHALRNENDDLEDPLVKTEVPSSKASYSHKVYGTADVVEESPREQDREASHEQSWKQYPQSVDSEPSQDATPDPLANRSQSFNGPMADVTLQEETDATGEALPSSESRRQPLFEVTVGEPTKCGDNINPFIMYNVRTRTSVAGFKSNDFSVMRRYSDFLWLYNQLTAGNPGVIIPPPPEKHALGRFDKDFIEARRVALERCLQKITSHPLLYGDPDLKLFLESETFSKKGQKKDSKPGLMKAFGAAVSNATGGFVKFAETDEWFDSRRSQLDVLETQLKSLMKAVDSLVKQRKDVAATNADFGESILTLATAEANKPLSSDLAIFGKLQKRLRELHDKQAEQDISTLENTVDEYIRLIGSIKVAFTARAKTLQMWQTAESDLLKRRLSLEKHRTPGRSRAEKIQQVQAEVLEMEMKVSHSRREFDEISKLIRSELERFDEEKVEDFKAGIERFLKSMVATQNEIIKLWESYISLSQRRMKNKSAIGMTNEQESGNNKTP